MRIEQDIKLDYKDVLIRPKRSTLGSRKEVRLERTFKFRNYKEQFAQPEDIAQEDFDGIPIMAANMDGVGTFEMADKLADQRIFTCLVKTYSVEELVEFFDIDYFHTPFKLDRTEYVAMSIGTSEVDFDKLGKVYTALQPGVLKYVCMDIANGYSEHFAQQVRKVREAFPHIVIIAGNVVTGEMTEELILAGADVVKVADGGCTCPGDVAKAFAAGADFVMLGGMLAGHDEGGGEVITKHYSTNEIMYIVGEHLKNHTHRIQSTEFVKFYGMSSDTANTKHFGGLKDYRSSEGREVLVPYRGEVGRTIQDLLGGLRSTCTYAGANGLKQLSKCTTFVRCTQQFNPVYEKSTVGK